jgi:putative DNA primase/helicase
MHDRATVYQMPTHMDDNNNDQGATTPPAGGGGPRGAASSRREKRKKKVDGGKLQTLLKHFVYQYGSNIAWDTANRMAILISNLRHTFGNDEVKMWLGSEKRRDVMPDQVVFDPTGNCGPAAVNLFGGLDMVPMTGNFRPILDLLDHLCDQNEEVYSWVLDWCAYPLQNLGAKMPTSVIMHGDEGSGKNLFWECVASLYGEYAKVVGQDQLEDKFNDWISKTCFVIGDEVLSRQEMRHLKGKLKAMISGKTIQINTKMMPVRSETNHVNMVFLSNELQPNALDASDRRYLVVWTPPKKEREFYQAVAHCIANGGREAFMDFLLKRDLSAFDPYAPPPNTQAKENLQDLGRPTPERFWRSWKANELPVPHHTCSSAQAYQLYRKWCSAEGEKWPVTQNWFGRMVSREAGDSLEIRLVKRRVAGPLRMWLVAPPPAGTDMGTWSEECIAAFDEHIKSWKAPE